MSVEPDLTIVTVSHGHGGDLRAGLPTWLDPADRCVRELVVVDNTGADDTAQVVAEIAAQATVIRNDRPRGFAENCNRGMEQARGRLILLLNPDVRVHPGAIDRLVRFMDTHPHAGIAGPKLLDSDGSLQYSCRRFYTPLVLSLRGLGLERALAGYVPQRRVLMQDWSHDTELDVDWVMGAAMIVRREALRDAGPLDPGYYLYCEDQDWCYRMWARGWSVYYAPDAVMTHDHRRASRNMFSRWKWIHAQSMLRMFRKQGTSGRRPTPASPVVAAGA